MPTKSPEVQAVEKQIKEEKKIAQETARREQASAVVLSSRYIRDFRIMNLESEQVLKVVLEGLEDSSKYTVSISKNEFSRNISDSLLLICEELKQYGCITSYMQYGNNVNITLAEFGKSYFEEKDKVLKDMNKVESSDRNTIFISHRTVDAPVADMIKDFLVKCGTPNDKIFCSSLPGNDVIEKISPEVKNCLKHSIINILILSKDYYESAYCLNEAGIAWYLDEAVVFTIGLPEINHNNMIGFLNSDFKLRRLDINTDISSLMDIVQEKLQIPPVKNSVITQETNKLIDKYKNYIDNRVLDETKTENFNLKVTINSDQCILLAYAAGSNGEILVSGSVMRSGDSVIANGFDFAEEDTPYECARWKEAVKKLEEYGLIDNPKLDGELYKVTKKGFDAAEKIKEQFDIDISQNPKSHFEK